MQNKELLGKRIKELRKAKNIKQECLAEQLGIEPRQLSKLETGKHYPSFETTLGLLNVFNITFEELINFNHLRDKKTIYDEIQDIMPLLNEEKLKILYKFLTAII